MAVEPHAAHVQEHRPAGPAGESGCVGRRPPGVDEVKTIATQVFQRRTTRKRRLDPATGGPHRNADAVVLADKDDRHRAALPRGPAGGVDRPLGGGMVGGGVAEAGEDHRVVRQHPLRRIEPLGQSHAVSRAHGLGQVRGDGAGLWRNEQRLGAQHLVPAATDRILGRGGEGEQHVPGRGLAGDLLRPLDLESRVPVVKEGHVGEREEASAIAAMPSWPELPMV